MLGNLFDFANLDRSKKIREYIYLVNSFFFIMKLPTSNVDITLRAQYLCHLPNEISGEGPEGCQLRKSGEGGAGERGIKPSEFIGSCLRTKRSIKIDLFLFRVPKKKKHHTNTWKVLLLLPFPPSAPPPPQRTFFPAMKQNVRRRGESWSRPKGQRARGGEDKELERLPAAPQERKSFS